VHMQTGKKKTTTLKREGTKAHREPSAVRLGPHSTMKMGE